MKKIAVGDLGEFWYGDYKEPFVQLEGAVPGYPQGVVLKADDGRLLCAYCGTTRRNLGIHVKKHGMTARQYKAEVGLLFKSALVSEDTRLALIRNGLRDRARFNGIAVHAGNASGRGGRARATSEYRNQTGRCEAQVRERARVVARAQGGLTYANLARHGIGRWLIEMYFGSIEGLARILAVTRPLFSDRMTRTRALPDAVLLASLKQLSVTVGRRPTGSDLRRYGLPSFGTYLRRFGSWPTACQQAGIDPRLPLPTVGKKAVDITDAEVLATYALSGSTKQVARALGVNDGRITASLHRYGFPFARQGRPGETPKRKEWAAEIALRLSPDMGLAS